MDSSVSVRKIIKSLVPPKYWPDALLELWLQRKYNGIRFITEIRKALTMSWDNYLKFQSKPIIMNIKHYRG